MTDSRIEHVSPAKPRFLWWRFALTVTILALLGWGFSTSWYCEPAPSGRQTAAFFLLLLVILVQTIQAGWYRNDFPLEMGSLEAIVAVLKVLVLLGIAAGIAWLMWQILSLTTNPLLVLFASLAAIALVFVVVEVSKGGGSGT